MSNLTKREIVLEIYRKSGFPQKQIVDTVQQTLDIVQKALANGRNVELRNFGVLEVQVRKQRIGRNPNKPEAEVVIPQRGLCCGRPLYDFGLLDQARQQLADILAALKTDIAAGTPVIAAAQSGVQGVLRRYAAKRSKPAV